MLSIQIITAFTLSLSVQMQTETSILVMSGKEGNIRPHLKGCFYLHFIKQFLIKLHEISIKKEESVLG